MPGLKRICVAVVGLSALTGAASALPLGQPGAQRDVAGAQAGVRTAAWQCFQFGNCIWRPDAYFAPYAYYGYRYEAPRPRYYRKRHYRY